MNNINVSDQPILLNDMVGALAQAAGGASQLMHARRDPRWIFIREMIECIHGFTMEQASFAASKISLVRPV